MKRAFRVLAAGLLVGLFSVSASGCYVTCGCAIPPDPADASAAAGFAQAR